MAYIEIPPIIVNILGWVCWMLSSLFLFLSPVGGETAGNAMMSFTGLVCLGIGTIVAVFWINMRYGLVAVKA